ncbi:MAG: ATP-binding protein [Alphaproteobacteria bacterium]
MRQAVTNLIQNALDSIQTKISKEESFRGQLSIIFHRDISKNKENHLFIVLNDNGLGLPEGQDPSKLSEPYVTHRERGTGLGLAIVKKIMQDHEGQLVIGYQQQNKKEIEVGTIWAAHRFSYSSYS